MLEPVGKPQLFKCRKSWFYKMIIWSALGTSAGVKAPLLLLVHLLTRVEKKMSEEDIVCVKNKKWGDFLFLFLFLSTCCYMEKAYGLNDGEEWPDLKVDHQSPFIVTPSLSPNLSASISHHLSASIRTAKCWFYKPEKWSLLFISAQLFSLNSLDVGEIKFLQTGNRVAHASVLWMHFSYVDRLFPHQEEHQKGLLEFHERGSIIIE